MTMKFKLTAAKIEAAKVMPGQNEIKLWDTLVGGLYLRMAASGSRRWYFRYRDDSGAVRSFKLGDYPTLLIDPARDAARAHAGTVAKGGNPAQVRAEKRRQERATLGALLAVDGPYERDLAARHIVRRKAVLSRLRRGLARLMHMDVAAISRREIVEAMDTLNEWPGARADLRKNSKVMLEWCVDRGLVQANCLAGMRSAPKSRAERIAEAAKRRALSDEDIVKLWRAADAGGKFGGYVQLLLLTGLRRNELGTLRWTDIKQDRIVLPPEITKTGHAHEVGLTPLMRSILGRQIRTPSKYVFPSERRAGRPMSQWSGMKKALMVETDIGVWRLHDMRRTNRTMMSRLGVAEPVAEAAIGHVKEALVGLYNLDEMWDARVDAFNRVSNHVEVLVGLKGPKIISLRAGAQPRSQHARKSPAVAKG
jgi:integrase